MAVVHPCDSVSLSAALDARAAGLIEPVLIGPRARILAVAEKSELKIDDLAIEDVPHSHAAAARAVELALNGKVDALMKGSLHTDELMAAVVASPLRTGRRMSHCFLMQTPAYPRPFIITDAAINIAPTLADKADIIRNAVDLAHAFGLARPRVAILAAVETINPNMPATLDAGALCKMADRGQIEGAILDGPLAFDNAVSAAAARTKGIVSDVAGSADILVVPDLESGNMLAKQLMYLGGAVSAGIVVGARVPIVLTSRADPRESRIASCAVALVCARQRSPANAFAAASRRAGAQVMKAPILVLNCGSSSIKFALFDGDTEPLPRKPLWAGKVDGIGANAKLIAGPSGARRARPRPLRSPTTPRCSTSAHPSRSRRTRRLPAAVAHRVVHGGKQVRSTGARGRGSSCRARRATFPLRRCTSRSRSRRSGSCLRRRRKCRRSRVSIPRFTARFRRSNRCCRCRTRNGSAACGATAFTACRTNT